MSTERTDALAGMVPSPTQKRTLPQMMSAIGARLNMTKTMDDGDSVAETLVEIPDPRTDIDRRSLSRGRDAFHSSGRGGAGNIRRSSVSRDARPMDGPDDFSLTRGREPAIHPDRIHSVGRGGAGNIHTPPHDAHSTHTIAEESEYQAKLVREHAEATTMHSSGRGGAGNISGSRSRSRGPALVMHSTGRGGAGNIHPGGSSSRPELLDEQERRLHAHHEASSIHSTGRGGVANISGLHEPSIEHHVHHSGIESTGRGGAGNIRTRSGSRDPGSRGSSKDKRGGIAALFDKIPHLYHDPAGDAK